MSPTNWPPAGAPSWPPPEISPTHFSAAGLRPLLRNLSEKSFALVAQPTQQEQDDFFDGALCNKGHPVQGFMLVNQTQTARYPFAICTDEDHRALLVLWEPFEMGFGSGEGELIMP